MSIWIDGNGRELKVGGRVLVARTWFAKVRELLLPGDPRILGQSVYKDGGIMLEYDTSKECVIHENRDQDIEAV